MRRRRFEWRPRGIVLAITAFAGINLVVALTASGFVPTSLAGNSVQQITANDLKPPECAGLDLTSVLGTAGLLAGSDLNELLLGSGLIDTIDGAAGIDCLVGGPGEDILKGGAGTDVCLGNGGTDTFIGCETEYQ